MNRSWSRTLIVALLHWLDFKTLQLFLTELEEMPLQLQLQISCREVYVEQLILIPSGFICKSLLEKCDSHVYNLYPTRQNMMSFRYPSTSFLTFTSFAIQISRDIIKTRTNNFFLIPILVSL